MFVMSQRDQLLADDLALGDQFDLVGELQELGRKEYHDIFVVDSAIPAGVLALEIGVDRHLSDAASTDGVDEIDSGSAALGPNGVDCGF